MTTIVRMAMALHAHWRENFDHGVCRPDDRAWDDLSPEERAYGIGQARAGLMAVREPDGAMVDAGRVSDEQPSEGQDADLKANFTAMIDHILSEGEG